MALRIPAKYRLVAHRRRGAPSSNAGASAPDPSFTRAFQLAEFAFGFCLESRDGVSIEPLRGASPGSPASKRCGKASVLIPSFAGSFHKEPGHIVGEPGSSRRVRLAIGDCKLRSRDGQSLRTGSGSAGKKRDAHRLIGHDDRDACPGPGRNARHQ